MVESDETHEGKEIAFDENWGVDDLVKRVLNKCVSKECNRNEKRGTYRVSGTCSGHQRLGK